MLISLSFAEHYHYDDLADGIELPVVLSRDGRVAQTTAAVDSGAAVCLFSNDLARALGINVEAGLPLTLDSLGGPLEAFGHEVVLQSCDLALTSFVYFAKYPGLRRNLLGRQGWLRQLRVAIVDYDNRIYLSRYDD